MALNSREKTLPAQKACKQYLLNALDTAWDKGNRVMTSRVVRMLEELQYVEQFMEVEHDEPLHD